MLCRIKYLNLNLNTYIKYTHAQAVFTLSIVINRAKHLLATKLSKP